MVISQYLQYVVPHIQADTLDTVSLSDISEMMVLSATVNVSRQLCLLLRPLKQLLVLLVKLRKLSHYVSKMFYFA